jgi:hypothetical protein
LLSPLQKFTSIQGGLLISLQMNVPTPSTSDG